MNANAILRDLSNRSFPLPKRSWKYYQQWNNTVFLHWIVPAEKIQELLPPGLELDTFEGNAWISLVAFDVNKMRLKYLPPFPFVSNFTEINVRTYVTRDGISGIYLFSIETDKFIEVLLTRSFIGLPYVKSEIKKSNGKLSSANKVHNYYLDLTYQRIGISNAKTELDYWLTERHCLYNYQKERFYRHNIHHKEWNLEEADISVWDINYNFNAISLNINPDKIHYSNKLDVLLWGREIA
jgi:uncharacterized protein YqjF (DUF2071 family)